MWVRLRKGEHKGSMFSRTDEAAARLNKAKEEAQAKLDNAKIDLKLQSDRWQVRLSVFPLHCRRRRRE